MSTLSKLKLVAGKRVRHISPVVARRNKLSTKLHEQLQLANAQREGKTYAPMRLRTFVNKETGERKTMEVAKRVKEWWWINEAGAINLAVKYGAKQLDLAKGKNAIELANGDDLINALQLIKTAVEAGELDAQIEAASGALRSAFTR